MYAPLSYPSWREIVRAMWLLLNTHYEVQSSRVSKSITLITIIRPCDSTQRDVIVQMTPFSLTNLQHIAQAIIDFEDALQMLLPKAPEQRRNWQDNDALRRKSRSDAIATIGKQQNVQQLTELFCPESEDEWCWYFFQETEVDCAQPGASQIANAVIKKVDHLPPFIEVCLDIKKVRQLKKYTPDLDGFKSFISRPPPLRAVMQKVMRKPEERPHPQPCQVPRTTFSGPRRKDDEGVRPQDIRR
jgi:hypothetical protein